MNSPREGILLGGLAGYNDIRGEISAGANSERRSQDIEGGLFGLYGTYFHGRFALDMLVKTELYDFDQRGLDCGASTGSAHLANYIIAANVYYRYDIGHQMWLEPTAGIRFTQSDFSSIAGGLAVDDGNALRLMGGARIGTDWVSADQRLWSLSFLGALYSDVAVNGYAAPGSAALDVQEGKLRALGQLRLKVTTYNGLSYYGQAEVRGGEDYWGVGGKVGLRYEW